MYKEDRTQNYNIIYDPGSSVYPTPFSKSQCFSIN